jgi:Regulator of ribonuclease activity B
VDIASINPVTTALTKKAKELNGTYDGWETFVIKSKEN